MRTRDLALPLFASLAFASVSLADVIVPVSQNRSVAGTASATDEFDFDSDSDSDVAVGFGPFVEGAAATAIVSDALGSGGGTQNSEIGGSIISAIGSSFANGEGYTFEAFGDGSGSSSFSVTFDVLVDSSYTLTGYVEAFDNGSTSMSLMKGAATLFSEFGSGGQTLINESGVLAAGQHTLNADTGGSAFGGGGFFDYASGAYDITLTLTPSVPVPRVQQVGPSSGSFAGGNTVLVTGTCFTPSTTVAFDGIPAASVTYVNENTLSVVVPAHPLPTQILGTFRAARLLLAVDVTVTDGPSQDTLAYGYVYGGTVVGGQQQRP